MDPILNTHYISSLTPAQWLSSQSNQFYQFNPGMLFIPCCLYIWLKIFHCPSFSGVEFRVTSLSLTHHCLFCFVKGLVMVVCTSGSVLVALPVYSTCAEWPSVEWRPRSRWRPWPFPCHFATTWSTKSSNSRSLPRLQLMLLHHSAGKPTKSSFFLEKKQFNRTLEKQSRNVDRSKNEAPLPSLNPPLHPFTAGCWVNLYIFCFCKSFIQ